MSSDFMSEKVKKKPINKSKIIKKIVITIALAVIFGVVASFVILLMDPFLKGLITKETPSDNISNVTFPEIENEKSPEEMLSDYMMQEAALTDPEDITEAEDKEPVELPLSSEQVEEILSHVTMDVTSYRQLATAMAALSNEMSKYIVTVTSISSSVDWLDSVNNNSNTSSGLVIANNNVELLILMDSFKIKQVDELKVKFSNGVSANGILKAIDINTKLAIVGVALDDLPSEMDVSEYIVTLGSSNGLYVGLPVLAIGSPKGIAGSMGYGIIDTPKQFISGIDSQVSIIQTNIGGSKMASGVLFNLQGKVIGIITNSVSSTSGENVIVAYGITELKNRIEKMSNGVDLNYLGIVGTDVTEDARDNLGIPRGAYIISTEMDSPAMRAGIQKGDIIVGVNDMIISSYSDYIYMLNQRTVGEVVTIKIKRKSMDGYADIKVDITIESFI